MDPFAGVNNPAVEALIQNKKKEVAFALKGGKRALEEGQRMKLKRNGPLGVPLYHNFVKYKNDKEIVRSNEIPFKIGFLTTKALDRDSFVVFNPKSKSFFINSTGRDLTTIFEALKKIAPGTKMIRGDMIFPPKKLPDDLTEEKFLKAIGLM